MKKNEDKSKLKHKKEYKEALAKIGNTFPGRYNFILSVEPIENGNKEYTVNAVKMKSSKTKINNIKFSNLGFFSLTGNTQFTTLGASDFETFDDFYDELMRLESIWGNKDEK